MRAPDATGCDGLPWEGGATRTAADDPPVPANGDRGRSDAVAEWLCHDLQPRLIASLVLYCGDRDVAEEMASEAVVRVWERWPRLEGHPNPTAWAHRVAINLANSWFRRRAAEWRANRRHGLGDPVAHDPTVADRLAVRRAVASLPKRQRTALVLRYYAGLSARDTAEIIDCAPATVRSLTRRAIETLRATGLHIDAEGDHRA